MFKLWFKSQINNFIPLMATIILSLFMFYVGFVEHWIYAAFGGIVFLISVFAILYLLRSYKYDKTSYAARLFDEKIKQLITTVQRSTKELNLAVNELDVLFKEREECLNQMEVSFNSLLNKGNELKNNIETWEKVPVESISLFKQELNKGNKRSRYFDLFLFFLGFILSLIGTILLKYLGLN